LPPDLREPWDVVVQHARLPLAGLRRGAQPKLCEALLTLHAVADEAHRVLAVPAAGERDAFGVRAGTMLAERGSLSHLDPDRIRVLPKSQLTNRGLTIRSFSRYVALSYEAVDLEWSMVEVGDGSWVEGRDFHRMLVPWPLVVDSSAFQPVDGPLDMDPEAFGFFSYAPARPLAPSFLASLIDAALDGGASSRRRRAARSGDRQGRDRASRGPAGRARRTRNYVHLGFLGPSGWVHYEQDKHHRWCLDPAQIRQYHLTRKFPPPDGGGKRSSWLDAGLVRLEPTGSPLGELAILIRPCGPILLHAYRRVLPGVAHRAVPPGRAFARLSGEPGYTVGSTLPPAGGA
jgi:hypothetical protein